MVCKQMTPLHDTMNIGAPVRYQLVFSGKLSKFLAVRGCGKRQAKC